MLATPMMNMHLDYNIVRSVFGLLDVRVKKVALYISMLKIIIFITLLNVF